MIVISQHRQQYRPQLPEALDLTKELIDEAITKAIPFSAVVVDAWYTSTDQNGLRKNWKINKEVMIQSFVFQVL